MGWAMAPRVFAVGMVVPTERIFRAHGQEFGIQSYLQGSPHHWGSITFCVRVLCPCVCAHQLMFQSHASLILTPIPCHGLKSRVVVVSFPPPLCLRLSLSTQGVHVNP